MTGSCRPEATADCFPRSVSSAAPRFIRKATSWTLVLAVVLVAFSQTGCRITNIESARRAARIASIGSKPLVKVKRRGHEKQLGPIRRLIVGRPDPSPRTSLFLRKNNLLEQYLANPSGVVKSLQQECRCEPEMGSVHAIAELAQLEADWNNRTRAKTEAAENYATAVVHAYQFLFDPELDIQRNAYDPQFREICDIYNHSLENLLRIICKSSEFRPGTSHFVGHGNDSIEFNVVVEGRWKEEEFEKFELVNDFDVSGIDNKYHTYGLGVPLIAIRKPKSENESRFEQYYPPSLALPLTAFCEVLQEESSDGETSLRAILRLYDPLEQTVVKTETRSAPLESDLTVPLAYYLNDPLLNTDVFSTVALLNADVASTYFGAYMLEPYNPDKIPVVMVHGLWSNPVTWMKMFNDLRANPWIRDHYQFWFYMYPTGQPFWISAANMRQDLANLRRDVDPDNQSEALQEMILVGHSMGGLLARMQTANSHDDFWKIISNQSIDQARGTPETISRIRELFYFEEDTTINKVITIAAPHRGSSYANTATRWLSHQIFTLPKKWTTSFTEFVEDNESILRNTKHLTIPTSVDSLSPESPFIQKLLLADVSDEVEFHNIVGNAKSSTLFEKLDKSLPGDGVVSLESAELIGAISSIEVPAEHMKVHQHPETVLEVKRILLENLAKSGRMDSADQMIQHATYEKAVGRLKENRGAR